MARQKVKKSQLSKLSSIYLLIPLVPIGIFMGVLVAAFFGSGVLFSIIGGFLVVYGVIGIISRKIFYVHYPFYEWRKGSGAIVAGIFYALIGSFILWQWALPQL